MSRFFVAMRALLWASLFVSLWAWLALYLRGLDVAAGRYLPFPFLLPGAALAVGGGVLALACVGVFVVRGLGTPAVFDPPREFVAAGPYRWVRNPMYVGGISCLLGIGLALRSPSVAALSAAAFALSHAFVVLVEEPGLARRFGPSYDAYRRSTNRWLPRPPRNAPG